MRTQHEIGLTHGMSGLPRYWHRRYKNPQSYKRPSAGAAYDRGYEQGQRILRHAYAQKIADAYAPR